MVGLLNDDFECCCKGPCSDLFPGIMKDEEKRKCCKGSTWSTLDISGLGDIQINQTRLFLFQFLFVGGGGGCSRVKYESDSSAECSNFLSVMLPSSYV